MAKNNEFLGGYSLINVKELPGEARRGVIYYRNVLRTFQGLPDCEPVV